MTPARPREQAGAARYPGDHGAVVWRFAASLGVTLAVVVTAAACVRPAVPVTMARPAAPVLAVITWNVHAGRGDLPRLVDDLTHGRITGRPVRNYVMLLQETIAGSRHDVVVFARERQLWSYFAPVRESDRGTSGNAFVATERPLMARTIVLPRERRMRKAIAASFEVEGMPLFIVNAHLENRVSWLKGGLFSDTARARQTRALLAELPRGSGIVGGDLNTWLGADEPSWRLLRERFSDTPPDESAPTFRERLVLDHLFFDLPDGWSATREVLTMRYDSDHHPVLGLLYRAGGPS